MSSTHANANPSALDRARTYWRALAPRERTLIGLAATCVTAALLWWIALAPALKVVRTAAAQHAALDAQINTLQSLQAQALQLQAIRSSAPTDRIAALRTSVEQQLGATGSLQASGERASVILDKASASQLAAWLAQARNNARAIPLEARLTRSTSAEAALWSGTIVLTLPPAP